MDYLVEVVTEDKRKKKHPTEQAIGQLLAKMEGDPRWFPGERYENKAGATDRILRMNKAAIARSAMPLKNSGAEPTYSSMLARNPKAAANPATGQPISPCTMSTIFKAMYYDAVP